MACLIAPATAAIAISTIKKKVDKKYHFDWLLFMLWGGTAMLLVDHILNGEIIFQFPFFTAGFSQIVSEVWRVGVPMTITIFVIWALMVFVPILLKRRQAKPLNA